MTNLEDPPEEIWRDYNQRAPGGGMEWRIEELKSDLAADDFCLKEFSPTGAAFLSILMLFNLLGEFQRASGVTDCRQSATLRVSRKTGCGAILGRVDHRTVSVASAPRWLGEGRRSVTCPSTKSCFTKFQSSYMRARLVAGKPPIRKGHINPAAHLSNPCAAFAIQGCASHESRSRHKPRPASSYMPDVNRGDGMQESKDI
ncbi:MAG: hypothetical protein WB763_04960 [Terriglobia bacterium]